jgi:hypothetical protein
MKTSHKFILAGTTGLAIVLGGTALALPTLAQATAAGNNNFAQMLSQKLGIEQSKVETAVTEVRESMHEAREAEMKTAVETAVKDGKLTVRQATILDKMHGIREEQRDKALAAGERPAAGRGSLEARQAEMLSDLKAAGLEVSAEELSQLHETMRELNLGGSGFGGQGFGGQRGRGMRAGE